MQAVLKGMVTILVKLHFSTLVFNALEMHS